MGSVHPLQKKIPTFTQEQEIDIVAAFHAHPRTSIRQVAANNNLLQSTIHKIVKKNGLKPYKPTTQHKLFTRDYGPRIQFSMSILQQLRDYQQFVRNIMITDECIFYTNGMTCHQNSRTTFPNRWIGCNGPVAWPPRSPDLSACDFFLWGYLKQTIFQTPVENTVDLTQRIIQACHNVPAEMLLKVESEFSQRILSCILNDGGIMKPVQSTYLRLSLTSSTF